jgi:hypothetical protein
MVQPFRSHLSVKFGIRLSDLLTGTVGSRVSRFQLRACPLQLRYVRRPARIVTCSYAASAIRPSRSQRAAAARLSPLVVPRSLRHRRFPLFGRGQRGTIARRRGASLRGLESRPFRKNGCFIGRGRWHRVDAALAAAPVCGPMQAGPTGLRGRAEFCAAA